VDIAHLVRWNAVMETETKMTEIAVGSQAPDAVTLSYAVRRQAHRGAFETKNNRFWARNSARGRKFLCTNCALQNQTRESCSSSHSCASPFRSS